MNHLIVHVEAFKSDGFVNEPELARFITSEIASSPVFLEIVVFAGLKPNYYRSHKMQRWIRYDTNKHYDTFKAAWNDVNGVSIFQWS